MVLAAFILSLLAFALSSAQWVRIYVIRRRATKALNEAIQTMARLDSARTEFARAMSALSSATPVGDLFPKGRN